MIQKCSVFPSGCHFALIWTHVPSWEWHWMDLGRVPFHGGEDCCGPRKGMCWRTMLLSICWIGICRLEASGVYLSCRVSLPFDFRKRCVLSLLISSIPTTMLLRCNETTRLNDFLNCTPRTQTSRLRSFFSLCFFTSGFLGPALVASVLRFAGQRSVAVPLTLLLLAVIGRKWLWAKSCRACCRKGLRQLDERPSITRFIYFLVIWISHFSPRDTSVTRPSIALSPSPWTS